MSELLHNTPETASLQTEKALIVWDQIKRRFGYDEITFQSTQVLAHLKEVASYMPNKLEPFYEVRKKEHRNSFFEPAILFFKPSTYHEEVYRQLSGWYLLPQAIKYKGSDWRSLEHVYQSSKFSITDQQYATRIHDVSLPRTAKEIGSRNLLGKRSDWEEVKELAMLGGTIAIAAQNSSVASLLDLTEEVTLVEDSPYDAYWGRGSDFNGKSALGNTWMLTREIMRQKAYKEVIESIEGFF